jgi:uncharacterized protein (TIGR02231 family)
MNRLLIAVAALFIAQLSTAENSIKTTAELQSVTVYTSGCQMNFQSVGNFPEGRSELRITHLPANALENSFQVKIDGNATLLGIAFEKDYFNPIPNSKIEKFKDSIHNLDRELRFLNDQKIVFESEEKIILNNQKLGGNQSSFNPNDLKILLEITRNKGLELKKLIQELDHKIEKLIDQKTRIENQISEWSNQPAQVTGNLILSIISKTANKSLITFSFRDNNAGWEPVYDIRKSSDTKVNIEFRAKIIQNTGINWNNIPITLSTSAADDDYTRPVLTPIYVDFYEPNTWGYNINENGKLEDSKPKKAIVSYAPPAVASNYSLTDEEKDGKAFKYDVVVNDNQLNAEFVIAIPQTIIQGEKATTIPVTQYDLPCSIDYYSVPKLKNSVYLIAKITNWGQFNLIGGLANIFVDGAYIGNTYFDPNTASDTMLIAMGKDTRISVKRIQLNDFKEKKILGTTMKETYAFESTIRNNKNDTITIQVYDQFPISRNAEIEVEETALNTTEINKETGEVHWTITLKPNETKKLRINYSIKFPKGKHVQLNH